MWLRGLIAGLAMYLCGQALAAGSARLVAGANALTEQALRHLHGEGVKRDADLAVLFFCAAARQGHAAAAYELGWLYFHGRGVERDDQLAAAWLREAARLGRPPTAKVMQRLAKQKRRSLACVDSAGKALKGADARRANLVLAVHRMAPDFRLDPKLVLEVIRAESNFDPRARSAKGALGLMQLIPATAQRFGVSDPYEPTQNIRGGMAYLRWLLDRFDGDLALSLAGYNAGEAAVDRYGGVPPYAETRAYVERILGRYMRPAQAHVEPESVGHRRALPTAHATTTQTDSQLGLLAYSTSQRLSVIR